MAIFNSYVSLPEGIPYPIAHIWPCSNLCHDLRFLSSPSSNQVKELIPQRLFSPKSGILSQIV